MTAPLDPGAPYASWYDNDGHFYVVDQDELTHEWQLLTDGYVSNIPLGNESAGWLIEPLIRSLIAQAEERPPSEALRSRIAMLDAASNLIRRALDLEADVPSLRPVPDPPEEPF